MFQSFLSLDQSPPFSAPSRFFLSAPLWGVFALACVFLQGGEVIASRWYPAMLAATHALAIGLVLQVMLGALIQVLPVLAGAHIPKVMFVASSVHIGINVGAALLCTGFLEMSPQVILLGAVFLAFALCVFLLATGVALYPLPFTSPVIWGLKLVWLGLFLTVGLGGVLVLGLNGWLVFDLRALVDWHAAWGLGGAVGLLIFVMATVVVPMFQLTPAYRVKFVYLFMSGLWFALWLFGGQFWYPNIVLIAKTLLYGLAIVFAVYTLWLQKKRRRASVDITVRLWQQGLVLLICWGGGGLSQAWRFWGESDLVYFDYLWGFIAFVGVILPLIVGMLYKVLPFLTWLHLQNKAQALNDFSALGKIPNMNHYLSKKLAHYQAWSHWVFVVSGCIYPYWVSHEQSFFGAVVCVMTGALSFLLLGWLLGSVVLRYRALNNSIFEVKQ